VGEGVFSWVFVADFHFQGTSALALDAKGRLTVPARHRELLTSLAAGQLTITKHPEGCLMVFPRPVWEGFRAKVEAMPLSASGWKRIFLGSAMDVEIDSGSRVLLSPELRGWAQLDKELMLVGMGGRMEIWDRDRYLANEEATLAQPMPDALRHLVI